MSSAGSIMDMINRFNQNRAMLRKKRPDARTRMRQRLIDGFTRSDCDFYRDDIPAGTVERVKKEIRENFARERKRNILITILSVVIAIAVLAVIVVIILKGYENNFDRRYW